jgi:hypothetical protein
MAGTAAVGIRQAYLREMTEALHRLHTQQSLQSLRLWLLRLDASSLPFGSVLSDPSIRPRFPVNTRRGPVEVPGMATGFALVGFR